MNNLPAPLPRRRREPQPGGRHRSKLRHPDPDTGMAHLADLIGHGRTGLDRDIADTAAICREMLAGYRLGHLRQDAISRRWGDPDTDERLDQVLQDAARDHGREVCQSILEDWAAMPSEPESKKGAPGNPKARQEAVMMLCARERRDNPSASTNAVHVNVGQRLGVSPECVRRAEESGARRFREFASTTLLDDTHPTWRPLAWTALRLFFWRVHLPEFMRVADEFNRTWPGRSRKSA